MTLLPTIQEIQLFGVFDRGIPNKERVVLRPTIALDIGNYIVVLGASVPGPSELVTPLRDHMVWFGSGQLSQGDWIFLYTGHGTPSRFPTAGGKGQILTTYWKHDQTLFHDAQFVPVILRLSGLLMEARPTPAAQHALMPLMALTAGQIEK